MEILNLPQLKTQRMRSLRNYLTTGSDGGTRQRPVKGQIIIGRCQHGMSMYGNSDET